MCLNGCSSELCPAHRGPTVVHPQWLTLLRYADLYKGKVGVDAEEASHVGNWAIRATPNGHMAPRLSAQEGHASTTTALVQSCSGPAHVTCVHMMPCMHVRFVLSCAEGPCFGHTLQLMNNLDFKNAVEEMKQAVDYLKATGSAKARGWVVSVALCKSPCNGHFPQTYMRVYPMAHQGPKALAT